MTEEESQNEAQNKPQRRWSDFPIEEYRLVPVEEWDRCEQGEDEIDLVELGKYIWSQRVLIYKVTGVALVVGLLIALLSPVEYQSSATLMPEYSSSESGGSASDLLKRYGGLIGISGGSYSGSNNAISVMLYPNVVSSLPVQLKLLKEKVKFTRYDTTTTVQHFFDEVYTHSVFSLAVEYSIGLPHKVKEWIFPKDTSSISLDSEISREVITITEEQLKLVEMMRERVTVSLDEESGIVTVKSRMPDPYAAAAVGDKAFELLKRYLTEYRTEKLQTDLDYVEEQYEAAKQRFIKAQQELAEFRDQNINLATAKAQTELERLQSEYDLAFNIYNSLAQQREKVKLKLQEQTPLFKTLQPFTVPIQKSSPKRSLIAIASLFVGSMLAVGWSTVKFLIR
jgi:uncharacterized protein involved in exopolysaccharide biosynthesis